MPAKRGRGRPRKITARTTRTTTKRSQQSVVTAARSRWTESYTSLLMGIVVVIVSVLFVVSFIKQTHHVQDTSSIATAITPTVTEQTSELQQVAPATHKTYTVQPGDDLWHIAEKFYQSGYNWADIAKANNLTDPGTIHSGNVLIIPNVTPEVATVTVTPTQAPIAVAVGAAKANAISGTTYTVQAGDDLWSIAVRAYSDGYQWTKIAQANNLLDPGLIFSGNVLKIPR